MTQSAHETDRQYDVSVIVPIYNVEEYLPACLDSLKKQEGIRLEVIMVDDGTPDRSGEIAEDYAAKNPGFFCYHKENGGLGNARNYGVKKARGKYIIFLDSDDKVAPGIYKKMFDAAEMNHCEMSICRVVRFNSSKTIPSAIHEKAFFQFEGVTHISRNHWLLYDTTSWNKMILRSFYEEQGFEFPERILYEDIPVTIPMHFLCSQVAMVNEIGYYWRMRDGASKSITQQVSSLKNQEDRLTIMGMLDDFFDKHVDDRQLHRQKQVKHLLIDLFVFINKCAVVPEEQAYEIIDTVNGYLKRAVEEDAYQELPLIFQQIYRHVRDRDLEGLIEVLRFRDEFYYAMPVEGDDQGALTVRLPEELFDIGDRNVAPEMSNSRPLVTIQRMESEGDLISIHGTACYRRVSVPDVSAQRISAWLIHDYLPDRRPLPVEQTDLGKTLTDTLGSETVRYDGTVAVYNYDGTGFCVRLDLKQLEADGEIEGSYKILIGIENDYLEGDNYLTAEALLPFKTFVNKLVFVENTAFQFRFNALKELSVSVDRHGLFITKSELTDRGLRFELNRPADSVWLYCGATKESELLERDGDACLVSYEQLKERRIHRLDAGISGQVGQKDVKRKTASVEVRQTAGGIGILSTDKDGDATIQYIDDPTTAVRVRRVGDSVLLVTQMPQTGGEKWQQAVLYLDDRKTEQKNVLASAKCFRVRGKHTCIFRIPFGSGRIADTLYNQKRAVRIEYRSGDGSSRADTVYRLLPFSEKFSFETLELLVFRTAACKLFLQATQLWKEVESTATKRKVAINEQYPVYRREPINRKRILFEATGGKEYGGNPQALYEYIDSNCPEYECIWSLNDVREPIRGRAKKVRRASLEYYYYLATCGFFVVTGNFPKFFVKRPGQIVVQTMKGTPMKKMGLEDPSILMTEKKREEYVAKNAQWDLLMVQGGFMKDKAGDCFGYHNAFLETGYPRTDILYGDSEEKARELREKLGIPDGKTVILYAPTWRVYKRFDMHLDVDELREALGDDCVLLIKAHLLSQKSVTDTEGDPFLYDLTEYQCIEELYLIADILVTDYSAAMFDFALTGKPQIFFAYDLEEYREELRGLYVDYEEEMPGPIVFDNGELIREIRAAQTIPDRYREKMERIREVYLGYEGPDSCAKIVREVLEQ